MSTIIMAWLTEHVMAIVGYLAMAVTALITLFAARQSGKDSAHNEQLKEAARKKDEQIEAATNRPANRDELVERLRNGGF